MFNSDIRIYSIAFLYNPLYFFGDYFTYKGLKGYKEIYDKEAEISFVIKDFYLEFISVTAITVAYYVLLL